MKPILKYFTIKGFEFEVSRISEPNGGIFSLPHLLLDKILKSYNLTKEYLA